MKTPSPLPRRAFLAGAGAGVAAFAAAQEDGARKIGGEVRTPGMPDGPSAKTPGAAASQRLSLAQLQAWEKLGYGMFLCFGMSTFVQNELPSGADPASVYAPDKLDVDQWVSVARDAGMKYAVLTAKHVAGHCLWPSDHTDYSVKNSADTTDVVAKFMEACRARGVLPGIYYCSWDNRHRFSSRTPSDGEGPHYTTSLYQDFQTAQITELLTRYGAFAEVWIDIPGVLGRGYRTFLYNHIASLQPATLVMMNSGISTQETYDVNYAWPSDLVAIERRLPAEAGFQKLREIEGKTYYLPGEVCDPVGKEWFWVEGDTPRPDEELSAQYKACRERGVNLLLSVPPDKHGVIPEASIQTLARLRQNAGI